jgi:Uma2 family endonuclease
VVEASEISLHDARRSKLLTYAATGIPESWLFDVNTWALERHTQPRDGVYEQVARAGRSPSLASPPAPALRSP